MDQQSIVPWGDLFTGTTFEVFEIVFFLIGFHHSPPLDDLSPLWPIGESFASVGREC